VLHDALQARGKAISRHDAMIENKEQFASAFIPYLSEFLVRASAAKPDLAQVQVPHELQGVAKQLGISFKTSFGMGTATVIPWLACFLGQQPEKRACIRFSCIAATQVH
jgi:hypothetical protein